MDITHGLVADVQVPEPIESKENASDVENIKFQVDKIFSKVDQVRWIW